MKNPDIGVYLLHIADSCEKILTLPEYLDAKNSLKQ